VNHAAVTRVYNNTPLLTLVVP